jgi:hypothetical protein
MWGRFQAKLAGAVAAAAVAALTSGAPASGAVIGPTDLTDAVSATGCVTATCTHATPKLPGATTRAPFTGTIVSWKVSIPAPFSTFTNDGPLRLQVLKRTANKPGIKKDKFEAVRETPEETAMPNSINLFEANLRIREGLFIGVATVSDTVVNEGEKSDAVLMNWGEALVPGVPARAPTIADRDRYNLFNARVKK